MKGSCKIKLLKRKNADKINELINSIQQFSKEEKDIAIELIEDYLEKKDEGYYVFSLEITYNQPIGYICIGDVPLTKNVWEIYWIAIKHDEQRKGYATMLIEYAEEYVRKRKARMLILETETASRYLSARKLYKKNGYRKLANIPDYYDRGNGMLIFGKKFN